MPRSDLEHAIALPLRVGSEHIVIHLKKDRYKTVRLRVRPDGAVLVRAPQGGRQKEIMAWLAGRAAWILERQRYFQSLRAALPPPGYGPNDIQRFLGRDYALRITEHVRGEVCFDERHGFHIRTRGVASEAKVRTLLSKWFQNQAGAIFSERLSLWLPGLWAQGGPFLCSGPPQLKVRAMCGRYGSCSRRGVITLSRHLAAMPVACIDYVLVHELCHLRHFAHDLAFYKLLRTLMPDWQERKARLKEYWCAQF